MYINDELYYANILILEDDKIAIVKSGYFLGAELNHYIKKGFIVEIV